MKKITKFFLFCCALLALNKSVAQVMQIINLSTGYVNSSGVDGIWQVMPPGTSSFQNCYLDSNSNYPKPTIDCGKWIGPASAGNFYGAGYSVWKMNFTTYGCSILSAKIVFQYTDADDSLLDFNVDTSYQYGYGTPHPCFSNPAYNPLNTYTVNIPPSALMNGVNHQLTFDVGNFGNSPGIETTPVAFALCANLYITYSTVLTPVFTTSSTICSGAQIIVDGSATNDSTVADNVWTVVQCDQYGNNLPSNPPVWWSPFFPGSPGYYAIPDASQGGPTLTCGNYYRVGLAVQNPCNSWAPTSQVIYVTCPPAISLGPDQTLCGPGCVSLSPTGGPRDANYHWVIQGDEPYDMGTGSYLVVCPSKTTTYCATLITSGCPATTCVTVNVENNNPKFILTATPTDPSYQTFSATPIQTTGLPPGFQFLWLVEELDGAGNTVYSVSSLSMGSCWSSFPGPEVFSGFNGLTHTLAACTPSLGEFKYTTMYRVTRCVRSTNCPWQQYAYLVAAHKPGREGEITPDPNAPDQSALLNSIDQALNGPEDINSLMVYPNPSDGLVNFNYSIDKNTTGKISITDILGRTIQTVIISSNNNTESIDMSANKNGIYFVNLFSGDKLIKTQKLILNH